MAVLAVHDAEVVNGVACIGNTAEHVVCRDTVPPLTQGFSQVQVSSNAGSDERGLVQRSKCFRPATNRGTYLVPSILGRTSNKNRIDFILELQSTM
jgi:hypothetical protein